MVQLRLAAGTRQGGREGHARRVTIPFVVASMLIIGFGILEPEVRARGVSNGR